MERGADKMGIPQRYIDEPILSYATEEDHKRFDELHIVWANLNISEDERREAWEMWRSLEAEVTIKYIIANNNDANIILQDIYKKIESITTEQFEDYIGRKENYYNSMLALKESVENKTEQTADFIENEIEKSRIQTIKSYNSFYTFTMGDIIYNLMDALDLWDSLDLGAEPIPPKGIECTINQGETTKIDNWRQVTEIIDSHILKKYRELYPEDKEASNALLPAEIINLAKEIKTIKKLDLPIDQLNSVGRGIWDSLEEEKDGQYFLAFYGKENESGEEITTIVCNLKWEEDNTTISKKLTDYDKLVHNIVATLYNAGYEVITITQIYKAMNGSDKEPSSYDTKKILASLERMRTAIFDVNNEGERKIYPSYPICEEYDSPLLSFEKAKYLYMNKKITAIHLLQQPPLMRYATQHKHITTVPLALLKAPLDNTEGNIRLKYYFMENISHMKNNPKFSKKMLFDTICRNCKVTNRKQKERLPGKIKKILDHFVASDFIKGYKEDNNDITIIL
jgi:hypothetical protein